jgi:hypothetical protein
MKTSTRWKMSRLYSDREAIFYTTVLQLAHKLDPKPKGNSSHTHARAVSGRRRKVETSLPMKVYAVRCQCLRPFKTDNELTFRRLARDRAFCEP